MTTKTNVNIYAARFRDHSIYLTAHVDKQVAFTAPDENEVEGLILNLAKQSSISFGSTRRQVPMNFM